MKEKQKLKNARGITLVALVVTIIVLIILAGVSINMVLGQNGIVTQAKEAKEKTLNAQAYEQEQMNEVVDYIQNNGSSSGNNSSNNIPKDLISKETSYIGYYADINGDGTVDGVIYADLAIGGSGEWGAVNGTYSYKAISGIKDYYVSQTNYEGNFGTKDVLTATGSGEDRFYVMALEDFNAGTYYCWYDAAYDSGISEYATVTSTSFGSGKINTETMIERWNSSKYGTQNADDTYADMWGVIQNKVSEGWFVASKEEWSAFGDSFNVTYPALENLGLKAHYWSSSLKESKFVWLIHNGYGYPHGYEFSFSAYIRLSTTF